MFQKVSGIVRQVSENVREVSASNRRIDLARRDRRGFRECALYQRIASCVKKKTGIGMKVEEVSVLGRSVLVLQYIAL